jgi:hypothetical protein
MAIDSTKKSNRLLQSRRYTHDTFTDAQEAFTSTLDINASEVYIDANLIPSASLPFSGSGQNGNTYTSAGGQDVLKYWYRQPLTKSNLNNEVWFFLNPSGSNSGIGAQLIDTNQQTNFVSPKYSIPALANSNTEDVTPGYGAKVIVAGTQVSTNNYTFDYKTGVLQFVSSGVAPSNGQVVTITAYQYVGRKLIDTLTDLKGTFRVFATYSALSTSPVNNFTDNQIVYVANTDTLYKATITYADFITTYSDSISWDTYTFGGGGTTYEASNGLTGSLSGSTISFSLNTGSLHFQNGVEYIISSGSFTIDCGKI